MSELSDSAQARVLLGDFASVDPAGKITVIGAGWTVTGVGQLGGTAPNAVMAFIDVPSKFYGDSCSVELALFDDTGTPVNMPGQGAIRAAQIAKIERPSVPGAPSLPPDFPSRIQILMNFPVGLPLAAGQRYTWRLQIDGNSRPDWEAYFYVLGPPPSPVIG